MFDSTQNHLSPPKINHHLIRQPCKQTDSITVYCLGRLTSRESRSDSSASNQAIRQVLHSVRLSDKFCIQSGHQTVFSDQAFLQPFHHLIQQPWQQTDSYNCLLLQPPYQAIRQVLHPVSFFSSGISPAFSSVPIF